MAMIRTRCRQTSRSLLRAAYIDRSGVTQLAYRLYTVKH